MSYYFMVWRQSILICLSVSEAKFMLNRKVGTEQTSRETRSTSFPSPLVSVEISSNWHIINSRYFISGRARLPDISPGIYMGKPRIACLLFDVAACVVQRRLHHQLRAFRLKTNPVDFKHKNRRKTHKHITLQLNICTRLMRRIWHKNRLRMRRSAWAYKNLSFIISLLKYFRNLYEEVRVCVWKRFLWGASVGRILIS